MHITGLLRVRSVFLADCMITDTARTGKFQAGTVTGIDADFWLKETRPHTRVLHACCLTYNWLNCFFTDAEYRLDVLYDVALSTLRCPRDTVAQIAMIVTVCLYVIA